MLHRVYTTQFVHIVPVNASGWFMSVIYFNYTIAIILTTQCGSVYDTAKHVGITLTC